MLTLAPVRNNSVDLFRSICAVCVVIIHTKLFSDVNPTLGFFVDYLMRFAVPFFFCASGYYYMRSLLNGTQDLKRQLKSILKPYIAWSIVYYPANFLNLVILRKMPVRTFLADAVIDFFTKGSNFHFWYFTSLIYALLLVSLVFKVFGKKGFAAFSTITLIMNVFGVLGTAYRHIGMNIPLVPELFGLKNAEAIIEVIFMGFAYFSAGFWVLLLHEKLKSRSIHLLLGVSVLANLAEISLLVFALRWTDYRELYFSSYFLAVALLLTLLIHPMRRYHRSGWYSRWLSGIVYYVHPLFIGVLTVLGGLLGFSFGSIMLFVIVSVFSFLLGFICLRWDHRLTRALLGRPSDRNKPGGMPAALQKNASEEAN